MVNLVRPQDLDAEALAAARTGKVDTAAVAADLKRAGLDADDALVDGLLAEARDHAERRALEDEQREVVAGLDVPTYELPRLHGRHRPRRALRAGRPCCATRGWPR